MLVVEQDEDLTVIVVKGALDPVAASALAAELSGAESQPFKRVIVSLERCSAFSDRALSVLTDADKQLKSRFLVVVPRREAGRKILETRGIVDNASTCSNMDEARTLTTGATPEVATTPREDFALCLC